MPTTNERSVTAGPRHGAPRPQPDADARRRLLWSAVVLLVGVAVSAPVFTIALSRSAEAPPSSGSAAGGATTSGPSSPLETAPAAREASEPYAAALAWLARTSSPTARVVVPDPLLERARTALPARTVLGAGGQALSPGDLVVRGVGSGGAGAGEAGADGLDDVTVARFGTGEGEVEVGQAVLRSVASRAESAAQRRAARELLEAPDLLPSGALRDLLEAGRVDPRLLVVLTALTRLGPAEVDVAPDAAGAAAGSAARSVVVRRLDGQRLDRAGPAAPVLRLLRSQDAVLRPIEPLGPSPSGVVVAYPLPVPPALFTAALVPTVGPTPAGGSS